MGFAADHQWMASAAFVINNRKHIDVYLKLIFMQMNIVECNWVWDSIEIIAMNHFFFVTSRSNAMFIVCWEIGSFEKVKKLVTETALIVVTNINYCFIFG